MATGDDVKAAPVAEALAAAVADTEAFELLPRSEGEPSSPSESLLKDSAEPPPGDNRGGELESSG